MEKNIAVFLDIKNCYRDYASCMQTIDSILLNGIIQNKHTLKISIKKYNNPTIVASKLEEPLNGEDISSSIIDISHHNISSIALKNAHFHIRVHKQSDHLPTYLMNLHYIAMLLVKYSHSLVKEKRISVFLVPESGEIYPFNFDNDSMHIYEEASAHLRLILNANHGIVYAVKKDNTSDKIRVTALNYATNKSINKAFPVIIFQPYHLAENEIETENLYIDKSIKISHDAIIKSTYNNIDHYSLLFRDGIAKHYLKEILKLPENRRFGYSNYKTPEIALVDYIFESAYKCLKEKIAKKTELREIFFDSLLNTLQTESIFLFSIFSFILSLDNIDNDEWLIKKIKDTLVLATELSNALSQLIQNSLQHSSLKTCILSLLIVDKTKNQEIKIIVSDLGSESILETFPRVLEQDKKTKSNLATKSFLNTAFNLSKTTFDSYSKLIDNPKHLKLSYLFNDFNDADPLSIELWHAFRQYDSSAHIGLALFANIVRKCSGCFWVLSNGKYECDSSRYYSFNAKVNPQYSIPGTQFNITIPIIPLTVFDDSNVIHLNYEKKYVDNYETYSKYLDYYPKNILSDSEIESQCSDLVKRANSEFKQLTINKTAVQTIWCHYWSSLFIKNKLLNIEKTVAIIDFKKLEFRKEYVKLQKNRELILKGLMDALSQFCDTCITKYFYFAITNLDEDFIDCFMSITQALAIKTFPKNLQLFTINQNYNIQIHLFGNTYGEAIQNSYIHSIENGTNGYSFNTYDTITHLLSPFLNNSINSNIDQGTTHIMPFSMFVNVGSNTENSRCVFFDGILKSAERELDSAKGYKIHNTHIRLGNKVHMNQFYEMSFLFYRTILANRTAFLILNKLKECNFDLLNDHLLFYGYASYSQAILVSLISILNKYRETNKVFEKASYAIYQYNLQSESTAEDIQVYFNDQKKYNDYDRIKVIQIVPISSTLTTFGKMWLKLREQLSDNGNHYVLAHNHTVFWVRDEAHKKDEVSEIEKNYFMVPKNNTVETKVFGVNSYNRIHYILEGSTLWQYPDKCKLCYPDNVINEVPLIETDPTSTVPSQQIYYKKKDSKKKDSSKDNNFRISQLNGFVYYGHVCRGKNDYQYYINTQDYFNKVSQDVIDWLKNLRLQTDKNQFGPQLHVIFSPEHNTNVGFSQFVNTYYFNGTAEIISINEDKEFRSNFICEHLALKSTINRLFDEFYQKNGSEFSSEINPPVYFYFVDDVIISGSTIHKAASLLQSLIPNNYLKLYTTGVFYKCFFLIDRLSIASKKSYVLPCDNFLSFCHIDVSNMRKHGDSCVGCKLLKDSKQLLVRSSTYNASRFWSKKINDNLPKSFQKIAYDDHSEESYLKFVLSHIIKNLFDINTKTDVIIYKEMLDELCLFIIDANYVGQYNEPIKRISECLIPSSIRTEIVLKCFIKIISRPFITYNHKIKWAAYRFLICFAEGILSDSYTTDIFGEMIRKYLEETFKADELVFFLMDTVFEALTDLNSTYLLRKTTIKKVLDYIENINKQRSPNIFKDFWLQYSHYIQRLINLGSDETRSLWLENLLLSGDENIDNKGVSEKTIYIFSEKELSCYLTKTLDGFKMFCKEIFLTNGVMLKNGIRAEEIYDNSKVNKTEPETKEDISTSNVFFNERWEQYREIDYRFCSGKEISSNKSDNIEYQMKQTQLSIFLEKNNGFDAKNTGIELIKKRYDLLIEHMKSILQNQYGRYITPDFHLAIMTISTELNSNINISSESRVETKKIVPEITCSNIDIISHSKELTSNEKYTIKQRTIDEIRNPESDISILKYSISLSNNYIIICFDSDNEIEQADYKLKQIIPVYFYIGFKTKGNIYQPQLLKWLIMRSIMIYRYDIMNFLAADFTSDVMLRYAHFRETEAIMQHEKTISHSPTKEDRQLLEFIDDDCITAKKVHPTIYKWIIARNYCNTVIARLYNRVIGNLNKSLPDIIADSSLITNRNHSKLYIEAGQYDGLNKPIKRISNIIPIINKETDIVFKLFSDIIYFECNNKEKLEKALPFVFFDNNKEYTYNQEFIQNIIYRICFDALRFSYGAGAANFDFADRINNHYLFVQKKKSTTTNPFFDFYKMHYACKITFDIQIELDKKYSFLVISNELEAYEDSRNEQIIREIQQKLKAPLDFADGHLSLIAEKEYVSKPLAAEDSLYMNEHMFSYQNGCFVTKLPIISTKSLIERE